MSKLVHFHSHLIVQKLLVGFKKEWEQKLIIFPPIGMSGGSAEGNDKSEGQRFSCKNKLTALVVACQRFSCKNKLTALVVDNGAVCRAIQTALLRSYGVETEAVETGEAAVQLIASGATFNLIIIEMLLPVLNGPEVYITSFYIILLAKGPSLINYLVIHNQLVIISIF